MPSILLLLVLILVPLKASEHIYFVKPDNNLSDCPSQEHPCQTLNEYASNQSEFFTSNSTFLFLPGTHTTRTVVLLVDVSNILLKGYHYNLSNPRSYQTDWSVKCVNVSAITLKEITIRFAGNEPLNTILVFINSSGIRLVNIIFQGNLLNQTRAILLENSTAILEKCTFRENVGVVYGGALLLTEQSKVIASDCIFISNSAKQRGGAIMVDQSHLWVSRSSFANNSAAEGGGVYCHSCSLSHVSVSFHNNSALTVIGGALVTENAKAMFVNTTMVNNSGGASCFYRSDVKFSGENTVKGNINIKYAGGAFLIQTSSVSFSGTTLFQNNFAVNAGGAIACFVYTTLIFGGVTKFVNNRAEHEGGAIVLVVHSKLEMHGSVQFLSNNCTSCPGGAVSVADASKVEIFDSVIFQNNTARIGGAIYVDSSTLVLNHGASIKTMHNYAKHFGGGIFHVDFINYFQCSFTINAQYSTNIVDFNLPDCFLQFRNFSFKDASAYRILSFNDTAGIDGQFMYGGLMDKCHIADFHQRIIVYKLLYNVVFKYKILRIQTFNNNTSSKNVISSEAFTLCFCKNDREINCTAIEQISTLRGSRFEVSVVALSQGKSITSPTIIAKLSKTARLKLDQTSKQINPNCSTLSYNMYSTEQVEQLVLYPDEACRDTGLAQAIVNVTFLPCPYGFVQSGDQCVCEKRLQTYTDQCIVGDEKDYITKKPDSRFWIGYSNNSGLKAGLILCHSCPIDYCKNVEVNISVTNVDAQCSYKHGGLLCGSCAKNYSLIFGDSRCQICSNSYLLLLIAFTVAGILLLFFISVLRLTVATGTINSIILYANIVQANKLLFFSNENNVLTVFIAWMNLDLGIPTCFYNGMDAYAQTWLQFAFPLYVWFLISLIIITSRYSTLMTKLMGSNPIAVLATLLLMSYTKILKNIIGIYSSVHLEYPDRKITVWFKDATVPYLESHHLVLAVSSSVFIAIFFFPYTIFLLLGYKIYSYSGRKYIRQIMMKLKPLLDSYYAPHEKHSRFWPGLLLLVRCGLFVVFTLDYIHGSNYSLQTVSITFSILIFIAWLLFWFSVRVYRSFLVNSIEMLLFLNLIVLSILRSNGADSLELTFSLVAMVFIIMTGVVFFQFYFLYIAKSALWQKFVSFLYSKVRKRSNTNVANERTPLINTPVSSVTCLREPVMDYIND